MLLSNVLMVMLDYMRVHNEIMAYSMFVLVVFGVLCVITTGTDMVLMLPVMNLVTPMANMPEFVLIHLTSIQYYSLITDAKGMKLL